MDTRERISFLLERYADNTCSVHEFEELFTLINNSENKTQLQLKLKELWENTGSKKRHTDEEWEVLYAAMMEDSNSSEEIKPRKRSLTWRRMSIAAIILIALTSGLLFYIGRGLKPLHSAKHQFTATSELVPGGNKAILTLANGSKIILNDKTNGVLARQTGVEITKAADGQLRYILQQAKAGADGQTGYNTITTPKGGQYQILMADGTKIWLNAMSSLKYPVTFSGKARKVELNGEAYFEVAKSKHIPFIVKTAKQEVEVLGTHFNINSYPDEANIKTTLLEGSVKVSYNTSPGSPATTQPGGIILTPGQQSSLTRTGKINVSAIDTELAVAWKNGNFIFEKDNLEGIMRQISRWYDVEVIYIDEKVKKEVFSGSVSRFENASQVLDVLQLTGLVHFKIEGRRIMVTQ